MKCPRCNKENPEHKEMCLACGYPVKPIPVPPGGRIQFGGMDWFVLDKKEDRMLLLSKKSLQKCHIIKKKQR